MPTASPSWHLPCIPKHRRLNPDEHLYILFLQRMSVDEKEQVMKSLEEVDSSQVHSFDRTTAAPRQLDSKRWIRDYFPSSNAILEIARHANAESGYREFSYPSLILVDSGWEASTVIAARWELVAGESKLKFNAARVPMNVANVLLSTCDANEGLTLAQALGDDVYEETKVDFYEDARATSLAAPSRFGRPFVWEEHFEDDYGFGSDAPPIVSLRRLSNTERETLKKTVLAGQNDTNAKLEDLRIYQWKGPGSSRRAIYHIFKHIFDKWNGVTDMFFVDDVLEGENHEPQIMAAMNTDIPNTDSIKMAPIPTTSVLPFWTGSGSGKYGEDLLEKYGDIWRKEVVVDLEPGPFNFSGVDVCPVFFLEPFTADQERRVRTSLSTLDHVEQGEDWGNEYCFFGYLWPDDNRKHSLEDLKDLFESCDPFNPAYNANSSGPYLFANYPHHFVAVDSHCLDETNPKVLIASSLDFHGEDVSDDLGWTCGLVPATEAHLDWLNFDIANAGPEEVIEQPENVWLSDLKEYRENDWPEEW
ncbi:uncharacterized protein LTR77_001295 [Saxophila tyrrhenica]|uniref:BRCT domain-containing protein n=1 Tax=Saxophila tyrrhenica TaxID=1690608 RepID=A0AAV9PKN3_9PEZI|nr:hypothetical protein LTR77_001295 [Saxophila tyrrhenica]